MQRLRNCLAFQILNQVRDYFEKCSKRGTVQKCCTVGLFSASLILVPIAHGQGRAALSGKVADSGGALIPAAVVTATQTSTGTITVVNSNATGVYVFPSLPASIYSISVSSPGFRPYKQIGITLQADQSVTIDVTLQPGGETQTVTVNAEQVQVDTTTGTLSQVIGEQSVGSLPLGAGFYGRNAATLTELSPGVILGPTDNSDQGTSKTFPVVVNVSVNGARSADTNYMFDGGNNIDEYTSVNQPFPFPDALQEFSIQASNYDAEFGQNAGGVVDIVSKSGTEKFHGDLFEFVRNGLFNAAPFFGTVDPEKRNQFGGTLGGPVEIPFLARSKHTFFFFGYQHTVLIDRQSGATAYVPTQTNLTGDFSGLLTANGPANPLGNQVVQLYYPSNAPLLAGTAVPGNVYNFTACGCHFDTSAVAFMKDLPSLTGTGEVHYQNPLDETFNEFIVRVDQDLGASDHLTAHYYMDEFTNEAFLTTSDLLSESTGSHIRVTSGLLSETHTFSSHLLNSLIVNYSQEISNRGPAANSPNITDFGVNISQPSSNVILSVAASGFFTVAASPLAVFQRNNYTLTDDLHWVKGTHSIAFGVHAEISKVDINSEFNQAGSFNFNTYSTNYALASFLFGQLYTFNQGSGQYFNDRDQFYGFYAQDTWHAKPKLTIDYGVRYEPFNPWRELEHRVMQFNPAAYAADRVSTVFVNAPAGLLFPGDAGVPEYGIQSDYKKIMPRFGFAYDVRGDGSLSVRGGAGLFYDTRTAAIANSSTTTISPFSEALTLTEPAGPFSNPYLGITDPFPAPGNPSPNFAFEAPYSVFTFDRSGIFHVPLIYAYNLAVEQKLSKNFLARIAYAGSHATHLFTANDLNPSIYIAGSSLPTNQRRTFNCYGCAPSTIGYSDIGEDDQGGNSNYNSLQATLVQHATKGLSYTLNYTYSKSLDNLPLGTIDTAVSSGAGDPYAIPVTMPNYKRLDIGPSDFDRKHVFSGSYVWAFPKLTTGGRVLQEVVNDWQTTGIVQLQSGQPLTITAGSDISKTGLGQDRAVWNGQRPYGVGACGSNLKCKNYLNPADFSLPAPGTFGNVVKGSFRGPGYADWDAALTRSFAIEKAGAAAFELKAEYFNVINRDNLINPVTSLSAGGFGSVNASNSSSSDTPQYPRSAQFSAKFVF